MSPQWISKRLTRLVYSGRKSYTSVRSGVQKSRGGSLERSENSVHILKKIARDLSEPFPNKGFQTI